MASAFTTTLLDPQNPLGSPKRLEVQGVLRGGGLDVRAKGFGANLSGTDIGTVARLELSGGRLRLKVFATGDSPKPTHVIDLTGTRQAPHEVTALFATFCDKDSGHHVSEFGLGDRVRVSRPSHDTTWRLFDNEKFLGWSGFVWSISPSHSVLSGGSIGVRMGEWTATFPPSSLDILCRFEDIPPPPPPPPTGFKAVLVAIWNILSTPL